MKVQITSEENLITRQQEETLQDSISEKLKPFLNDITRVKVHLSEEKPQVAGQQLLRCLLEARFEHTHPVSVVSQSNTAENATDEASLKMKTLLDNKFGSSV